MEWGHKKDDLLLIEIHLHVLRWRVTITDDNLLEIVTIRHIFIIYMIIIISFICSKDGCKKKN